MDREKALEIVKSNWPEGRHQLSEALETLIPEFRLSEGEKARKRLIEIVNGLKGIEISDEEGETLLRWLDNADMQWSKDDESMLSSIINDTDQEVTLDHRQIDWIIDMSHKIKYKPTHEQMEILKSTIHNLRRKQDVLDPNIQILLSLYTDLQLL